MFFLLASLLLGEHQGIDIKMQQVLLNNANIRFLQLPSLRIVPFLPKSRLSKAPLVRGNHSMNTPENENSLDDSAFLKRARELSLEQAKVFIRKSELKYFDRKCNLFLAVESQRE